MRPPDFEQNIGIGAYFINEPGIGGKLRVTIDDFQVTELFLYPPKKENGIFTIAEVSASNWETHTLVKEIANRLHVSQRRISFAGTKDKRAKSTQLMSFDHIAPDILSQVTIKDVTITNMYQSDSPMRIGDLSGNHFEIAIRNIENAITSKQVEAIISPLEQVGGFPNYYGIQRFGIIRPITHLVGKYIIHGDFEKAVMTYIANPLSGEDELTYALRADLEATRDYTKAFHSFPDALHFEKAILNKLIQDPTDFVGALRELPKNLLLMFVNAYESVLFNRILTERITRGMPIHQAVVGDIVFPVRKNIVRDEFIPVSTPNLEKVNTQISKKKAVVTGLLLGYNPIYAKGEMGEIECKVTEEEKFDPRDFIIPEIPFLSSSGTRRGLFALISNFSSTFQADDISKNQQMLSLRFDLQKGCYATAFLREIMKTTDPRNY